MKLIRKFKIVSLLGLVFILAIGMTGCGDDSTTTAVTNPNPNTLAPTGHIQGVLRDASTLEPIVNAVIDIGFAKATTSQTGQFFLKNVPVTVGIDCETCDEWSSFYRVTVDMRKVTSPVNMTQAETPEGTYRYGDFYFRSAMVTFSSLDDTSGEEAGSGSGSNHDTPVIGIASNVDFQVGQMSATLNGVVAGCDDDGFEGDFYTPVGEGFTVVLTACDDEDSGDTASGADYNIVGSTTTDENGAFSFANIEAGQDWDVMAMSPDGTLTDSKHVDGIGHMMAENLTVQESTALHVCSDDVHGPTIVAISPEPGSDIAPGTQDVVFTFSEPVKQTASTSTDPSGLDNLYDHLNVIFVGNKADLVAYTAAWNAAFTQLTVTFTTAASGKYAVRIVNIDDWFTDESLQEADRGVCPDDSVAAGALGLTANGGDNDPAIYFTTNGGLDVDAPTIVLANAESLNVLGTPVLDWLPVAGAKSYNVYRSKWEFWSTGNVTDDAIFITNTTNTAFTDGLLSFIENNVTQLAYSYWVTAVNSDTVESEPSNVVIAKDVIDPELDNYSITAPLALPAAGETQTETITLTFSETMPEGLVEDVANYSLWGTADTLATDLLPVITEATQISTTQVALEVELTNPGAGTETFGNDWALTVNAGVTDIAGNSIDTDANRWNNSTSTID